MKTKTVELPQDLLNLIEELKDKKGNTIMILHKVQEIYGYIPRDVAMEISSMLNIPLAKIYGIITFYHLFKLKKPGQYKVSVCMGTACYLKGGNDLLAEMENILGVGLNTATEDGLFSIEAVRCLGCCGLAPVISINGKVYGNLSKDQLPEILGKYKRLKSNDKESNNE